MNNFELILPNYFIINGKKLQINLNIYRNLNYHTNNRLKKKYLSYIANELKLGIVSNPIEIILQYSAANENSDLDNLMVHFKYLNDALQTLKIIKNDNVRCVKRLSIEYIGKGEKVVNCICRDYRGDYG